MLATIHLSKFQMSKTSLAQEVAKLKSLLDVAAASTTTITSQGSKSVSNDEDEDMDVSFIREEVATQKEIIISRDQVCLKYENVILMIIKSL